MIRTLFDFRGRFRHAVAFLALVFSLSPAALKAQGGNTAPGTAGRDSLVMRTTFYFSPGNGEWIERSDYLKSGRLVRWAETNPDARIVITGWADASGQAVSNDTLSVRRARTVRNYLVRKGIAGERITYSGAGVDTVAENPAEARRADVWVAVAESSAVAELPNTAEPVSGVVQQSGKPVETPVTPTQLQTAENTQPLRQSAEDAATQSEQAQQAAAPPVQEPSAPMAAQLPADTAPKGRYLGLKTNLAAWAGTIMNVAADVQVGRHWSVELPVLWCPWYVGDRHAVKTFTLQPEARYWLSKPGAGHFFGAHAHVGWFNVKWERDRWQDTGRPLLGAGISYGYLLPFNEHWAAEFTIGAGYANMRYDTYYNMDNGARIDTRTKSYWGITRVGLSVVYRFNLKK